MTPSEEARIIAKAAVGNRRAQAQLVDAHLPRLYALGVRMLNDTGLAEDIAQEAFLRAWRILPDWRAEARLSTWLHRVALNLCYDQLRRKREKLVDTLPEQVDESADPADQLDQKQGAERLTAAIANLPDRQRAAISLCALGDLPQKEAAVILETSVDALESLLARARRNLRAALQEGKGEGDD